MVNTGTVLEVKGALNTFLITWGSDLLYAE